MDELNKALNDEGFDRIKFRMRNDHIRKGESAGAVNLNGTEMILIQK